MWSEITCHFGQLVAIPSHGGSWNGSLGVIGCNMFPWLPQQMFVMKLLVIDFDS